MPANPKVSFVVPCYKLAHYLGECVNSIINQTHEDFEVLIMDDCSPDNTPEVSRSFNDPRVKHIRNEPNLGHLRNYNKGIELSRGEYVWLISADDKLRSKEALDRYLRLASRKDSIGFVCCPATELLNGRETGVAKYSVLADHDKVFKGHHVLRLLLDANVVPAASGMVKRECYSRCGAFPLDLPFAGDWYLWCLFSLHYDVGFVAEPMVNYRGHDLSMTSQFKESDIKRMAQDSLTVLWRTLHHAEVLSLDEVSNHCKKAIGYEYARYLVQGRYPYYINCSFTLDEVEESIHRFASNTREKRQILASVYAALGHRHYECQRISLADDCWRQSTRLDPSLLNIHAKRLLLRTGRLGVALRKLRDALRQSKRSKLLAKVERRDLIQ
jgi:glycosyltransferase involved in cell wall biosynthesis